MMWEHASLILSLVVLGLSALLLLRAGRLHRQMRKHVGDFQTEVNGQQQVLDALLTSARQESERLQSVIRRAERLRIDDRHDLLAEIEELADPTALANPDRITELAAQMTTLPWDQGDDPFAANRKALAVARLDDQGHSPAYIAEQLGLSRGDVELLLNLRPGQRAQARRRAG